MGSYDKPPLNNVESDRPDTRFRSRLQDGWTRLRAPVGAASCSVWTRELTIVLIVVAVLMAGLAAFDGQINSAARPSDAFVLNVMRSLTDVVRSQWYLIPAALIFFVSGMSRWGQPGSDQFRVWSRLYGQSLFVFATVSGALLTTNFFKIIIGRARPLLYDGHGSLHFQPLTVAWEYASFPSGHSTTAAVLTVILMIWFPAWRWLFLLFGVFMSVARVAADAHYPSDIVAGFTVGFVFTLCLARWLALKGIAFHCDERHLVPRLR